MISTACARCDSKGSENTETEWVSHFRMSVVPDRAGCGLRRYEIEARGEYYKVLEHATCQPCLAAVEARHRQRELDDFYALDMERDTGEPFWDERGHRREEREHRETID
jgi:hypothetical protein